MTTLAEFDQESNKIGIYIEELGITVYLTAKEAQTLSSSLAHALMAARIADGDPDYNFHRQISNCDKKGFPSEESAKLFHKNCGWRFRTYLCEICKLWHVANQDKTPKERRRKNSHLEKLDHE